MKEVRKLNDMNWFLDKACASYILFYFILAYNYHTAESCNYLVNGQKDDNTILMLFWLCIMVNLYILGQVVLNKKKEFQWKKLALFLRIGATT